MTDKEIIDGLYEIKNWKCNGDSKMHSIIRGAIDLLEQTRWIPVSERLPEDGQEILFSTKTGRVHSGKYHDDDSVNQWYSHRDKCRAWNNVVNAWMPLPAPYEPQERSQGMTETEHAQWIRKFWKDKLDEIKGSDRMTELEIVKHKCR